MAKTKTLTLTAMFAALTVVGSFIKIPVPPGTAALDSTAAFISMAGSVTKFKITNDWPLGFAF